MTAVEWLFEKLWQLPKDKFTWYNVLEQAKEMEKNQTEISDEEIKNAALKEYNNNDYQYKHWEIDAWISACKWYREQFINK